MCPYVYVEFSSIFLVGRNLLSHQPLLLRHACQPDAESSWENLEPKMMLNPFAASADLTLVRLVMLSNSLYLLLLGLFRSLTMACSKHYSFLKDPTLPGSPILDRWPDFLFSWEKWGHLLRAPSILLPQTFQHFHSEKWWTCFANHKFFMEWMEVGVVFLF